MCYARQIRGSNCPAPLETWDELLLEFPFRCPILLSQEAQ